MSKLSGKGLVASLFQHWNKQGINNLNTQLLDLNVQLLWMNNDSTTDKKDTSQIKNAIRLLNYIKNNLSK
jgi:hypothetical protein